MSLPATLRSLLNTRPFFQPLIKVKLGDQLWALQKGLVTGTADPESGQTVNAGFGFDANVIPTGAANLGSVSTTTSATAGTTTTVTYTVPNSPATWNGRVWVQYGNGYIDAGTPPSYSAGVLTITVGSTAASQDLVLAVWNG